MLPAVRGTWRDVRRSFQLYRLGFSEVNPIFAIEAHAETVKIAAQMVIGIVVFGFLVGKFFPYLLAFWSGTKPVEAFHPLDTVGLALAFAAGIELAYMLFTPGPDEALTPVILGIASAILLEVSSSHYRPALPLAAAMALLFLVKELVEWRDRMEKRNSIMHRLRVLADRATDHKTRSAALAVLSEIEKLVPDVKVEGAPHPPH